MSKHIAPTKRVAKIVRWATLPTALLVSGIIIAPASYSAFSATTSNPTSNWAAGSVALTDDDASAALFTASALAPGSTGTKCIAVTSTGTLPSQVRLYGSGLATTNALSTHLNLTVEQGTGGGFGSCTGFTSGSTIYTGTLAGLSTVTSFGTGVGTWAPTGAGSESRTYRFTYTVAPTAPNTAQGGTASIAFTWEVQSN